MTDKTSISLDDHFTKFIDRLLQSGRYATPDEVVRAGLHLLEDREAKLTALQQAVIVGEESGQPAPFENTAFLKSMRSKHTG
jgi:antitoxin ParD1/3/4